MTLTITNTAHHITHVDATFMSFTYSLADKIHIHSKGIPNELHQLSPAQTQTGSPTQQLFD